MSCKCNTYLLVLGIGCNIQIKCGVTITTACFICRYYTILHIHIIYVIVDYCVCTVDVMSDIGCMWHQILDVIINQTVAITFKITPSDKHAN